MRHVVALHSCGPYRRLMTQKSWGHKANIEVLAHEGVVAKEYRGVAQQHSVPNLLPRDLSVGGLNPCYTPVTHRHRDLFRLDATSIY